MILDLSTAKDVIKAGMKKAEEMGILCSIAVVDDNGVLKALYRMNRTPIPTVDIAQDKAWTAATFRMASSEIVKYDDPSVPRFGFNTQNYNDRLTPIPGGLPIKNDDVVVGGIGVCGGTPEEDVIICQAAISSMG